MGRSQVLYNRTKGRFRNRVKQQSKQEEKEEELSNVSSSIKPQQEQDIPKQPLPHPSTSVSNRKLKEGDILLLAHQSPNQVNFHSSHNAFDDDETFEFESTNQKPFSSSSSLDITSLALTLATSVSASQRLKIPSYITQMMEKEKCISSTTMISVASSETDHQTKLSEVGQEVDNVREPTSVEKQRATFRSRHQKGLPAVPSLPDQNNLPFAPSFRGQEVRVPTHQNLQVSDDTSYSIGPDRIKTTENGDIEVRRKKDNDESSRRSREYDVDRYSSLADSDESEYGNESLTIAVATTRKKKAPHSRNLQSINRSVPKTKNKVAVIAKFPIDPPSYNDYHKSQRNRKEAAATIVKDESLSEQSKVAPATCSKMTTDIPAHEVDNLFNLSSSSSISTITRDTNTIHYDDGGGDSFWQGQRQRQLHSTKDSTSLNEKINDSIIAGAELGDDSLDAWLDDVIS